MTQSPVQWRVVMLEHPIKRAAYSLLGLGFISLVLDLVVVFLGFANGIEAIAMIGLPLFTILMGLVMAVLGNRC